MEYTINGHVDLMRLMDEVNKDIAKGWKPQGGITVHPHTQEFFLAMVREKPNQ